MQAVTAVFGQQVHVQGCFFHLCQSMWRRVQDLGLTALYNADDVAKHFVGILDGLALLPLADVPAGMTHLRANTPPASRRRDRLLRCNVRHWTTPRRAASSRQRRRAHPARFLRQPPLFAPDVWNVHVATVTGVDRTNNMCESWNSAFQRLVGHQHPGGVDTAQVFEEGRDTRVQESRGMPPRKRQKRVYVDLQARLKYLCDARTAGTKSVDYWTVSVTSSDFRLRLKLYYCNNKLMFRNDMADSSQIAQRTKLCLTYMDDNGAVNYQQ